MYYLTLQRNITEKYKLYINMAYSLSERLVYEIDKHSEFWHRRLYFGRMYVCREKVFPKDASKMYL